MSKDDLTHELSHYGYIADDLAKYSQVRERFDERMKDIAACGKQFMVIPADSMLGRVLTNHGRVRIDYAKMGILHELYKCNDQGFDEDLISYIFDWSSYCTRGTNKPHSAMDALKAIQYEELD